MTEAGIGLQAAMVFLSKSFAVNNDFVHLPLASTAEVEWARRAVALQRQTARAEPNAAGNGTPHALKEEEAVEGTTVLIAIPRMPLRSGMSPVRLNDPLFPTEAFLTSQRAIR